MGIKIVEQGDNFVVKGSTAGVNVAYFFAILFYIGGAIMLLSGSLGAIIPGIIGTVLI